MRRRFDLSLYLVTDPVICARHGLVETVRAAVAGGATMVQLRDKEAPDDAFIAAGRALRMALAGSGVPLIVNDRLDAVEAIGADGLHIGQSDVSPQAARARLGSAAVLGLSIETYAQTAQIDPGVIDYVGAGPVFGTSTKSDHATPIGFDGLRAIAAASTVPVVAIGGLAAAHAAEVLRAGAMGLAVVSAICGAEDPEEAARAIRQAMERAGP